MMTRREILTYFALAALTPQLCRATVKLPADAFAEVNRDIALNHIATGYNKFASATERMNSIISSFVDNEADIVSLRVVFEDLMDAWMAIQHLRFGPAQVQARAYRIQFWPDTRNRVGRQLGSVLARERTDLVSDPTAMTNSSVALQGLPALERLLYEIELTPGSYASQLAKAIANNLQTIGTSLATDWAPGGGWSEGLYLPKQHSKSFPTAAHATSALLLAITTQLEFIVNKKINLPLGGQTGNHRLRLAESWRSGRSLRNIRLNISTLINLYEQGEGRFRRLIESTGNDAIAKSVSSALQSGLRTIELLPDNFGSSISDIEFQVKLKLVGNDLARAQVATSRDVAPALGIILGFNSLDGD